MSDKIITITLTRDEDFEVDELWPDGDAPEVIDEKAVRDLIRDHRGAEGIRDWFPRPADIDVYVRSKRRLAISSEQLGAIVETLDE